MAQTDSTETKVKHKLDILQIEIGKSRVKPADLMHTTRQLAAFIRAGIPVFDGISDLAAESENRALRRVLTDIAADLRAGSTLTDAIAKHPADFPNYYVGILRSAELTGELDTVLEQLCSYIERDMEARRKLRSVMTYPTIIAIMAVGTVIVLTAFVLPQFTSFFADMHVELPAATQALLAVTAFLNQWWWLITLAVISIVIGYKLALRRRAGRRVRDRVALRIPVAGETIKCAAIERFTRILSSLVRAGIDLPEAMEVATNSLQNVVFEDALEKARSQMLSGAGLADPIAGTGLFPSMATQMIRVGENTGSLDEQLSVAAQFYATELDYKIKRLATVFEPLVVLVMGGIVGFVAIALVSAMYGVFKAGNLS